MKNQKQSENQKKTNFPNLRRGSLPSPQTPKFPLNSPATPNFTPSPNQLTFSPLLEEKDYGAILDELLSEGKSSSDNLLSKLLEQKEKEIERLEAEKEQWLIKEREWEQVEVKHQQLQGQITKQAQQIEQLNSELKESNDDFYQISEKNQELTKLLQQTKSEKQRLDQQLAKEVDENFRLKESQEQTNATLLGKINELTQLRKLKRAEREQLQGIITQQMEIYEAEKKVREEKFNKKFDNLISFQLAPDLPTRFKKTHRPALSVGNSPRSSYIIEDDKIIFSGSSSSDILSGELKKKGFGEKGGVISSEFTTTPQEIENNPFEDKKSKRNSNSPLFVRSPSPENIENELEKLLDTVNDLEVEIGSNKPEEVLIENEVLKTQQLELEKAYKTLADERVISERTLQEFNEKEQGWIIERQKQAEEIAELRYQLAEAKSQKEKAEKAEQKTKYQLKLKEQKEEEGNLETVQEAVNGLSNTIKELLEKQKSYDLESKIQILPKK